MADNVYSAVVSWLKVLLPLAALVLLSTLFLLARGPRPGEGEIPYADLRDIAREQRVSAPRFSGVTETGAVVAVRAATARPLGDGTDAVETERITAQITRPDGSTVTVHAGRGMLDTVAQQAAVAGLVRIETSDGYEAETRAASADLATGRVQTEGPVEARAPFGELEAGRLVARVPEGAGAQHLAFTDGVRLIYRPRTSEGQTP